MIHRLSQHIYLLELPRFQFPFCNCLWIEDDRTGLIDSSPPADGIDFIKSRSLDIILHSHGHLDHCFLTPDLETGEVLMHPADKPMAESADEYLKIFGFNQFVPDRSLHRKYLDAIRYRPISVTGSLYEAQAIDFGHTRLQVMHLPGHSAGHCVFFFPDQGFVFTADLDLSSFGPWYGNLNCSIGELLQSIDRLLELKPDFLVTGHGQAIIKEKVPARLKAYRDTILFREQRIIKCIRKGCHTLAEIARCLPVYQQLPYPREVFLLYEYVMDMIHLNHLQDNGRVHCENQHYYLV